MTAPTPDARPRWMAQARCAGKWRFVDDLTVAQQIAECQQCPVIAECREYGLNEPVIDKTKSDRMVWGGLSPRQRFELIRQRRRLAVVR